MDAHRLVAGARPERAAALGLERRAARAFGVAFEFRGLRDVAGRSRRSSSTRTVRSAAHGATRLRGAGLRRAARRRAGAVALVVALFLAARARSRPGRPCKHARHGLPRRRRARATARRPPATTCRRLPPLARRAPARARPRALARPVPFRPEAPAQLNPAGWPFGLLYWPLYASSARCCAWNVFVLLSYVGAGAASLRLAAELGLGPAPRSPAGSRSRSRRTGSSRARATCSGRSRCCSRSRSGRSSAAAAAGVARARGAALASIPLSGQVHLALGAIPFFLLYAVCRTRARRPLVGAPVAALVAVGGRACSSSARSIPDSLESGGRSLAEVGELLGASGSTSSPATSARQRELRLPRLADCRSWPSPGSRCWRRSARGSRSRSALGAVVPVAPRARHEPAALLVRSGSTSRRSATRACPSG